MLPTLIMAVVATVSWAKPPKMKMTTPIPKSVITPDEMKTRLGTLRFVDGFPTEETAKKIWDQSKPWPEEKKIPTKSGQVEKEE